MTKPFQQSQECFHLAKKRVYALVALKSDSQIEGWKITFLED